MNPAVRATLLTGLEALTVGLAVLAFVRPDWGSVLKGSLMVCLLLLFVDTHFALRKAGVQRLSFNEMRLAQQHKQPVTWTRLAVLVLGNAACLLS